jgi:predicted aspartyl protease
MVKLRLRKNKESAESEEDEFLVDSGAVLTVAPGQMLRRLGIAPDEEQTSTLANGERITRKVSDAYFQYEDKGGYSKVVFGEEGDSNLLGTLTLEGFGLVLDPLKRELKPLPMLLM